jgi:hypothetical protein
VDVGTSWQPSTSLLGAGRRLIELGDFVEVVILGWAVPTYNLTFAASPTVIRPAWCSDSGVAGVLGVRPLVGSERRSTPSVPLPIAVIESSS